MRKANNRDDRAAGRSRESPATNPSATRGWGGEKSSTEGDAVESDEGNISSDAPADVDAKQSDAAAAADTATRDGAPRPAWTVQRFAPLAATALVAAAVLSLVLTARDADPPSAPESKKQVRQVVVRPGLTGAYGVEGGTDGQLGRWMADAATLQLPVSRSGIRWVGFRALSYRRPRTIAFAEPNGPILKASVVANPDVYIVGPISPDVTGVQVSATPAASRGPGPDSRKLGVFVSTLRESPEAIVALPGKGFWQTEFRAGGLGEFNWLRQNGELDLVAQSRSTAAYVSFDAWSSRARTLTIRQRESGSTSSRALRAATSLHVVLGPIKLRDARARLLLRATPGPTGASQTDKRAVSVRISNVQTSFSRDPK